MNILTIDIEEWWLYGQNIRDNAFDYLPRLESCLDSLLDFLGRKEIKATFFCVGQVAILYPHILKKIQSCGHHIGCHSLNHTFLSNYEPGQFSFDTIAAISAIENVTGEKVDSYRAPAFSLSFKKQWMFEILSEAGILFDSSIYTASRDFGGDPGFPENKPCMLESDRLHIKEFPVPTSYILGRRMAYSGGGYFRLLPYRLIASRVAESDYNMLYFHIRDFDKEQKRHLSMRYFKDYYGIGSAFEKFQHLINDFNYMDIHQADSISDWDKLPHLTLES